MEDGHRILHQDSIMPLLKSCSHEPGFLSAVGECNFDRLGT